MSALELLAHDPARFIADTFGVRPEVTARGRDYSALGSLDSFDHLINDTLLPTAAFRLVRDGSSIGVKGYTKKFGGRDDALRVADPALVFDWFSQGATIILESLHNYSAPLREFCRELESELRQGTQVNAYITPPGAQGFATHVDSHDVFVVQVYGAKHWFVHDRDDKHGQGEPLIELDLKVGDCLYIPKGFPHSASTASTASAHLTIGILPNVASRIKRELLSLLGLPEGSIDLKGDAASTAVELIATMKERLDAVDETELARRLTRLAFASRHHSHRGQLQRTLDAETVKDSDKVVTRAEWVRFDDEQGITLLLPDRELRFTSRLAPAVDVVLRDEPFHVSELTTLSEEERVAFVARLIREGLLELR